MIIAINDKFRINSNKDCWMVQKYAGIEKETGKKKWNSESYHATLQSLVQSLCDRMIRESGVDTLEEALKAVQATSKALTCALSPIAKVEIK